MKDCNFFCGGTKAPKDLPEDGVYHLEVSGKKKNIDLRIESISKAVMKNIPDELLDLLEIGAYVYCADQKVKRGSEKLTGYGSDWRRCMSFVIPVRKPDLWNSDELKTNLQGTLGFLSGENFSFDFVQTSKPAPQMEQYFDFKDDPMLPDEVSLFSGGVDSFAGAVESIIGRKQKVALVGHHSANQVKSVQTVLTDGLAAKGYGDRFQYISIKVNNSGEEASEYTQRTRSFLFACLAMCVARMYGKDRFSFYENGVVSLNLPITKDVLESRATRTTHPRVINGFERIFSAVLKKEISVDHPYRWLTKAEVTRKVEQYECQDLLDGTNSCTRPRSWTSAKHHCGVCSQCIDRRFGILAAGMGQYDNAEKYKTDLLTGVRAQSDEIVMAASYVKFAQGFSRLARENFLSEHPQAASVLTEFPGISSSEAEQKIFDLHRRHSEDVLRVVEDGYQAHRQQFMKGALPTTCVISLFFARTKVECVHANDVAQQLNDTLDKLSVQRCRFFVDSQRGKERILFKGGFDLAGVNYNLVNALLPNFRLGKSNNQEIVCINPGTLSETLGIEEASLRKMVKRLREEVTTKLGVDQGIILDTDDFIENVHARGYRLNSNLREVQSLADLED